jgi:hypothetical protein
MKINSLITGIGSAGNLTIDKNGVMKQKRARGTGSQALRVLENNREFAGVANINKAFRAPIADVNFLWDSRVVSRLARIFKKINLEDGSEARGFRAIQPSKAPRQLVGFEFNKLNPFAQKVHVDCDVVVNAARNSATLTTAVINAPTDLDIATGATHFRIGMTLQSLSDYAWDFQASKYLPTSPLLNGLEITGYSDYLDVAQLGIPGVIFTLDLPQVAGAAPVLTTDVSTVVCITYSLYQKVNGKFYLFEQNQAMQVAKVVVA